MNKKESEYIHGTHKEEQDRLAILNQLLNDRCLAMIQLNGDEKVLDVGSGLGLFSRQIATRVRRGSVVGVEKSPEQLRTALRWAEEANESHLVDFREGSSYALPLESNEVNTFDLAFVRFLLEHLDTPQRALLNIFAALKPGGSVYLVDDDHENFRIAPYTPAFDALWGPYNEAYRIRGNDPYIGRNLVTLLHEAGFEDFQIDFVKFGSAACEPDFHQYANNLIGILVGARQDILEITKITPQAFDAYIREIRHWAKKPDAALWYAANFARGRKPTGQA